MSPFTFTYDTSPSCPPPLPLPIPLPHSLSLGHSPTHPPCSEYYMCVVVHRPYPIPHPCACGDFYAGLVLTALSSVIFPDARKPYPAPVVCYLPRVALSLPNSTYTFLLAQATNTRCWWPDQRSPGRSPPLHLYVGGSPLPSPHHPCIGGSEKEATLCGGPASIR